MVVKPELYDAVVEQTVLSSEACVYGGSDA